MTCYIFDIDGTLADNSHRTHHLRSTPKDWDAYHALVGHDSAHKHMTDLARILSFSHDVIFCTGRQEDQRNVTILWLREALLPAKNHQLYMRKNGDYRDDSVIKEELLSQIRADGYRPIMAFDDRDRVVAMWRRNGVPCAQVAEGDF